MRSSHAVEAPPFGSPPQAAPRQRRITLPLHRVLGFARQELASHPSRQLAFALRPLLGLALETTGLCSAAPAGQPAVGRRTGGPADPEILFSALSSLVEVVKALTPSTGRVYANLGHEAVVPPDGDADDGVGDTGDGGGNTGDGVGHAVNGVANAVNGVANIGNARAAADGDVGEAPAMPAAAPRSEVVIELVSTAASAYASLPAAVRGELGSLAFELAVVAAIVESKGGEFYVGSPAGDARSYVVRLPVQPGSAARGAG